MTKSEDYFLSRIFREPNHEILGADAREIAMRVAEEIRLHNLRLHNQAALASPAGGAG